MDPGVKYENVQPKLLDPAIGRFTITSRPTSQIDTESKASTVRTG
jgi:hypothetical protein